MNALARIKLTPVEHNGVQLWRNKEGELFAWSMSVADNFSREHYVLTRTIANLVKMMRESGDAVSQKYADDNFVVSEYDDPTGRKLPCYLLTEAGFNFVGNRLTGADVIPWQVRYNLAFQALKKQMTLGGLDAPFIVRRMDQGFAELVAANHALAVKVDDVSDQMADTKLAVFDRLDYKSDQICQHVTDDNNAGELQACERHAELKADNDLLGEFIAVQVQPLHDAIAGQAPAIRKVTRKQKALNSNQYDLFGNYA